MTYMRDDEFIILMDVPRDHDQTHGQGTSVHLATQMPDKLHALRQVGIQTAVEYLYWKNVEVNRGEYNWSIYDNIRKNLQDAGMKVIWAAYNGLPVWTPAAWTPTGIFNQPWGGYINPWNQEGIDYAKGFFRKVIEHFPDDLVIECNFLSGESIFWNAPYFQRSDAILDYQKRFNGTPTISGMHGMTKETDAWYNDLAISYMTEWQDALSVQKYKEHWNALQPLIATQSKANGNYCQEGLFWHWKKTYPDEPIFLIQYTYWMHPQFMELYAMWRKELGIQFIVEANYCAGLPVSAPLAIEHGCRGQIVAPVHYYAGQKTVEQWMLDNIYNAHKLWEQSHTSA